VQALLEREPIVVHKDGSYHIHLASLFESAKK
jgi:predicted  nucleic acid-binding Zn-ribbon protein